MKTFLIVLLFFVAPPVVSHQPQPLQEQKSFKEKAKPPEVKIQYFGVDLDGLYEDYGHVLIQWGGEIFYITGPKTAIRVDDDARFIFIELPKIKGAPILK